MDHRKFREERDILYPSVVHFIQGDCEIPELCALVNDEENLTLRATPQALPNLPR